MNIIEWTEHYHSHLWVMYTNFVYLYQTENKQNLTLKKIKWNHHSNFNKFCLMLYESTSIDNRKKLVDN